MKAIGQWAERVYVYACEAEKLHRGTFDGWCWLRVEWLFARLADLFDPIPGAK